MTNLASMMIHAATLAAPVHAGRLAAQAASVPQTFSHRSDRAVRPRGSLIAHINANDPYNQLDKSKKIRMIEPVNHPQHGDMQCL